jgi:hypothetical protein
MQFVRKKKRGQDQKVRRSWFSTEGYRIIARKEAFGIGMPARYQACVRVLIPHYGNTDEVFQMWDFVSDTHRLYKTMKAAQEDCQRHQRLWTTACQATGIRGLRDIFGKLPLGIPLWAKKNISRNAYAVLMETRPAQYSQEDEREANASDQPEISADGTVPSAGPVLIAKDGNCNDPCDVQPATAAEPEPRKRPRKPAAKPSKRTARKSVTTKGSSKSARKRSCGSRKRKALKEIGV